MTVCTAAADMDIGHPLVNCLREHFPATLPIRHSESYTFGPIHAYPLGEERTRINQAIDALIEDLKKKEIFIEAKPVRTSNISVKKPKAVSQKISYNFKVSQNGQFSFI